MSGGVVDLTERAPSGAHGRARRTPHRLGQFNRFNPRPAYDHVANLSIYVERDERGRGVGRVLLPRVIDEARRIGFHKMVLAAFPTNERGMQLYEALGFRPVGIYRERACSTAGGSTSSSWSRSSQAARAMKGPICFVGASTAGSTYRKYASPAAFGRRLAAGPFSSL